MSALRLASRKVPVTRAMLVARSSIPRRTLATAGPSNTGSVVSKTTADTDKSTASNTGSLQFKPESTSGAAPTSTGPADASKPSQTGTLHFNPDSSTAGASSAPADSPTEQLKGTAADKANALAASRSAKSSAWWSSEDAKDAAQQAKDKAQGLADSAKADAKHEAASFHAGAESTARQAKSAAWSEFEDAKSAAKDVKRGVQGAAESTARDAKSAAGAVKADAESTAKQAKQSAWSEYEDVKGAAGEAAQSAKANAHDAAQSAEAGARDAADAVKATARDAQDNVAKGADKLAHEAELAKEEAERKASFAVDQAKAAAQSAGDAASSAAGAAGSAAASFGRGIKKLFTYIVVLVGGTYAVTYYLDSRSAIHRWIAIPVLQYSTDPETAQKIAIQGLSAGIMPKDMGIDDEILATELFGRKLSNPIGLAAGFDKQGEAIDGLLDLGFGIVEIGSVTPEPQPGNEMPRYFRLTADRAAINRFGFNSDGHEAVLDRLRARISAWLHSSGVLNDVRVPVSSGRSADEILAQHPDAGPALLDAAELPRSARAGQLLSVNLGKNKTSAAESVDDYVDGVRKLGPYADLLVVNVSSPNTPGLRSLQRREALSKLMQAVVEARDQLPQPRAPLLVKIAPDLSEAELNDIADAALDANVDGLIVSNTTVSRPASLLSPSHVTRETGGLSGAPLKPLALHALATVYARVGDKLPLIGCGGIASGRDALDFAKAGASAVQLYTSFGYEGVGHPRRLKDELTAALKEEGTTWRASVGKGNANAQPVLPEGELEPARAGGAQQSFDLAVASVKGELENLRASFGSVTRTQPAEPTAAPRFTPDAQDKEYTSLLDRVNSALGTDAAQPTRGEGNAAPQAPTSAPKDAGLTRGEILERDLKAALVDPSVAPGAVAPAAGSTSSPSSGTGYSLYGGRSEAAAWADAAKDKAEDAKDAGKRAAGEARERAQDAAGRARGKAAGVAERASDAASSARDGVAAAAGSARDSVSSAAGSVRDGVASAAGSVRDHTYSAAESARDNASAAAGSVRDNASAAAGSVRDNASSAASSIRDNASAAAGSVRDNASSAAHQTRDAASSTASSIRDNASYAADKASYAAQRAGDQASYAAREVEDKASSAARSTRAAARSASDSASSVAHSATGAVSSATSTARDSLIDAYDATKSAAAHSASTLGDYAARAEHEALSKADKFRQAAHEAIDGALHLSEQERRDAKAQVGRVVEELPPSWREADRQRRV